MNWNPKGDLARVWKLYESGYRDVEKIAWKLRLSVAMTRRLVVICKVMRER